MGTPREINPGGHAEGRNVVTAREAALVPASPGPEGRRRRESRLGSPGQVYARVTSWVKHKHTDTPQAATEYAQEHSFNRRGVLQTAHDDQQDQVNIIYRLPGTKYKVSWVTSVPTIAKENAHVLDASDGTSPTQPAGKSYRIPLYEGAQAEDVDPLAVEDDLGKFRYWFSVTVQEVPTAKAKDQTEEKTPGGWKFDQHIGDRVDFPFALYQRVSAVAPEVIDDALAELESNDSVEFARSNPTDLEAQDAAECATSYHMSLSKRKAEGASVVTTLVGAETEERARELAGMYKRAVAGLPWHYVEISEPLDSFDEALSESARHTAQTPEIAVGLRQAPVDRVVVEEPENDLPGISKKGRLPYSHNNGNDTIPMGDQMLLGDIIDTQLRPVNDLVVDGSTTNEGMTLVGKTGAGKTRTAELYAARYLQRPGTNGERRKVVFITSKKTVDGDDDVAQEMANMLAKLHAQEVAAGRDPGRPYKVARWKIGDPRGPAVGYNPLDPQGTPMESYLAKHVVVSSKSMGVAGKNTDAHVLQTISRYNNAGILGDRDIRAETRFGQDPLMHRFGWDWTTGQPLPEFTGAEPVIPPAGDAIDAVVMATTAQRYTGEAGDVGPWASSIERQKVSGFLGSVWEGARINMQRLVGSDPDGPDVTFIDASILPPEEYAYLMGTLVNQTRAQLGAHDIECLLVLDEANALFGNDSLDVELSELSRETRQEGGSVVYAVQDLAAMSGQVAANTEIKAVHAMQGGPNVKAAGELIGEGEMTDARRAELPYLGKGEMVLATSNGISRGQILDISDLVAPEIVNGVPQPVHVYGADILVDPELRENLFTTAEFNQLNALLVETPMGRALTAYIEMQVMCMAFGLDKQITPGNDDQDLSPDIEDFLDFGSDDVLTPKQREYLLRRAAETAVHERSRFFLHLGAITSGEDVERIQLSQIVDAVIAKTKRALDPETPADPTVDDTYQVPGGENALAKGTLITHVTTPPEGVSKEEAARPEYKANVPPYDPVKLEEETGVRVTADTAMGQFNAIPLQDAIEIMFVNDPASKASLVERVCGNLEIAITEGLADEWLARFQREFIFNFGASTHTQNFLYYVAQERIKRETQRLAAVGKIKVAQGTPAASSADSGSSSVSATIGSAGASAALDSGRERVAVAPVEAPAGAGEVVLVTKEELLRRLAESEERTAAAMENQTAVLEEVVAAREAATAAQLQANILMAELLALRRGEIGESAGSEPTTSGLPHADGGAANAD